MEILVSATTEIMWELMQESLSIIGGYRSHTLSDWIERSNSLRVVGYAWPRNPVIKSVPGVLREENERAYTPSDVSIGPLHREKSNKLTEMEKEKLTYMSKLFERTGNSEQTKEECTAALRRMENTLKRCYPEVGPDEDVVPAVAIDSCFIIELLYRHSTGEVADDPILGDSLKLSAIRRDLLLLENQIPFSALEELFTLTVERFHNHHHHVERPLPTPAAANRSQRRRSTLELTLTQCVLSFFGDIMGLKDGDISKKGREPPLHILHLLHNCYKPAERYEEELGGFIPRDQEHPCSYKPTATQLEIAGVKLRKREIGNLFYLTFRTPFVMDWRSGRLEIPRFTVSNITESFLRNLMAFEHYCPWIGSYFTSHAFLMDILIDSVEDVKLLEEAGIIHNHLSSTELVVQIFNSISKNAVPHHFYYNKLFNTMELFCTPQRAEIETVKRNCAGNLWIRLTIFAATVLFVLTFLQTLYAMISYHRPRKA